MSLPSRVILPSVRVPSIRSFMRFRQRRKVDFPHPDGPTRARTDFSSTVRSMSNRAGLVGYRKLTFSQTNLGLRRVRSPDSSARRVSKMGEYSRDTQLVLIGRCEEAV